VALAGIYRFAEAFGNDRVVEQAARGDQVGDVGERLAFAPLIAVQFIGPDQGATVSG
jgi:hypothetical protein